MMSAEDALAWRGVWRAPLPGGWRAPHGCVYNTVSMKDGSIVRESAAWEYPSNVSQVRNGSSHAPHRPRRRVLPVALRLKRHQHAVPLHEKTNRLRRIRRRNTARSPVIFCLRCPSMLSKQQTTRKHPCFPFGGETSKPRTDAPITTNITFIFSRVMRTVTITTSFADRALLQIS